MSTPNTAPLAHEGAPATNSGRLPKDTGGELLCAILCVLAVALAVALVLASLAKCEADDRLDATRRTTATEQTSP